MYGFWDQMFTSWEIRRFQLTNFVIHATQIFLSSCSLNKISISICFTASCLYAHLKMTLFGNQSFSWPQCNSDSQPSQVYQINAAWHHIPKSRCLGKHCLQMYLLATQCWLSSSIIAHNLAFAALLLICWGMWHMYSRHECLCKGEITQT